MITSIDTEIIAQNSTSFHDKNNAQQTKTRKDFILRKTQDLLLRSGTG
jgi:hypothetical protein